MSSEREQERLLMVKSQLQRRGIRNEAILNAFLRVPRHEFLSEKYQADAYRDGPLPIGGGQTISQPYMVAVITESARVKAGDKVLEVGTGSGYQAAILAELGVRTFTIERIPELFEGVRARLDRLGYDSVQLRCGDGTLGWPEEAPFDAILVSAGCPEAPEPLLKQLALGGRLVAPLAEGSAQVLYIITRESEGYRRERGDACTFVPLIGEFGWEEDPR